AEHAANTIQDPHSRAETLRTIAIRLGEATHWSEAERIALALDNLEYQAEALLEVAQALEQAGEPASRLWHEAERAANTIQDPVHRAEALRDLAGSLGEATHWSEAERIALALDNPEYQAEMLRKLAQVLEQAGESAKRLWHEAEQAANTIQDPYSRASALGSLVDNLGGTTRWPEAERIALALDDPGRRARVLHTLAIQLAEANHYEEAEHVVNTIQNPSQRVNSFCHLASILAKAGNHTRAWTLLQKIAPTITPTPTPQPPTTEPVSSEAQSAVTALASPEATAVANPITFITTASAVVGLLKRVQETWTAPQQTPPLAQTQAPERAQIVAIQIRVSTGDEHEQEEWVKDSIGLKHYIEILSDPAHALQPLRVIFVQASGQNIRIEVSKDVQNHTSLDEVLASL
ncbi:MAG TPA: hypothetical protein VFV38_02490, partial [Ktedonobacteraceae bacterium]|nr:hypothetical protein [Ktedonobacteraceae bacterium]